jgi:N-methylhydantoinase B
MLVSEAVELTDGDGGRGYRCARCEHSLGPADQNYKLAALIEQESVSTTNPHTGDPARYVDEKMVARRFYCPGCGVLLDTEIAREQDPPLWDLEID